MAQEVRELAQRSAKAAKEIKALISASNQHVRSGVDLVGTTGRALREIVDQVVHVNENVAAIAEASKEQSTGLKEINIAMNTMDQGTQQNAAMVEETSAAAHSLAQEAEQLFSLLGQFKVGDKRPGRAVAMTGKAVGLSVTLGTQASRQRPTDGFNGNAALKTDGWEAF